MSSLRQEIGDLLSAVKEDRVTDDKFSCPKNARKKAMDFLARREYGYAELIKKLSGKGYVRDIARLAVEELKAEGLQSDYRFSSSFVQSRIHQGKGPVRIRLELGQRGIDGAVVEIAIEESGAAWTELAKHARIKKFGFDPARDFAAKAKQMRFLQYRGFEQDHIQAAVGGD